MPEGSKVYKAQRGYYVILTPNDPLSYPLLVAAGAQRKFADDFVLENPLERRFGAHRRSLEFEIAPPWIEFRHSGMALGTGAPWKTPSPATLKAWAQ
jgi:hypothetical protein